MEHSGVGSRRRSSTACPIEQRLFPGLLGVQQLGFGPFLKHAELRLMRGDRTIGTATYHYHGGLDFWKFGSVPSKVDPIVDRLFGGYQ
jgi:hypothetical protein